MRNFIERIECVIEPNSFYPSDGSIELRMRMRSFGKECGTIKIEHADFMKSHFDLVFDHLKEELKKEFLKGVDQYEQRRKLSEELDSSEPND
jgi:hypothetical protein